MDQLVLEFDPRRLARASGPETSKTAAERTKEFKARHSALIWDALRAGPMTKDELAKATGLTDIQVARRGKECVEAGLVTIGPDARNGCRIWRRID